MSLQISLFQSYNLQTNSFRRFQFESLSILKQFFFFIFREKLHFIKKSVKLHKKNDIDVVCGKIVIIFFHEYNFNKFTYNQCSKIQISYLMSMYFTKKKINLLEEETQILFLFHVLYNIENVDIFMITLTLQIKTKMFLFSIYLVLETIYLNKYKSNESTITNFVCFDYSCSETK
jgi:hypothetical protein